MAEGEWLTQRTAGWVCSWRECLLEPDDAELAVRLRKLEKTGRPLGEEGFVESVGQQIGRDITKKKPGPKPKEAN